jgi:hypothetical protein
MISVNKLNYILHLQEYIVHLQEVNRNLAKALKYWLPEEEPLSFGIDEINKNHRQKWHEDFVLMQSESNVS